MRPKFCFGISFPRNHHSFYFIFDVPFSFIVWCSREEEMQQLNRSTNSKMASLSLLSLLVCLSVAGLQFWHLKTYFERKKLLQFCYDSFQYFHFQLPRLAIKCSQFVSSNFKSWGWILQTKLSIGCSCQCLEVDVNFFFFIIDTQCKYQFVETSLLSQLKELLMFLCQGSLC